MAVYGGIDWRWTDLTDKQWRSQDIGNARAQHGHTMFVRNFAQIAEAHALLILWILQTPRLVMRPYRSAVYVAYTPNSHTVSVQNSAMLCCSLSRRFDAQFAINNDTISTDNLLAYTCTGGAWPLVARACAPVCPSLATPLSPVRKRTWCQY